MENPGWDTRWHRKKIPILIPAPRFYIVTLCVEAPPWWHRHHLAGSGRCPRLEMGSSGSAFPRGAPAVPRISPLPSRDLSCSTFGMFGSAGWGQSRSSLQPEQLRRSQLRATFLLGFFLLLFSFFFFFTPRAMPRDWKRQSAPGAGARPGEEHLEKQRKPLAALQSPSGVTGPKASQPPRGAGDVQCRDSPRRARSHGPHLCFQWEDRAPAASDVGSDGNGRGLRAARAAFK